MRMKNLYLEYYEMISDKIENGNKARNDFEIKKFLNKAPKKPFKLYNQTGRVTYITPQTMMPIIIQHYERAFNNLIADQSLHF